MSHYKTCSASDQISTKFDFTLIVPPYLFMNDLIISFSSTREPSAVPSSFGKPGVTVLCICSLLFLLLLLLVEVDNLLQYLL